MKTYTVVVDALGYTGGCARKGETITAEQVGVENIDRLLRDGYVQADFVTPGPKGSEESAPVTETLASGLSVGLPPGGGYVLSEEEKIWVLDVKGGIIPVPFDADRVQDLTVKEIKARIEGLGVVAPKDPKKADAVAALQDAIVAYFEAWEIDAAPAEDAAPAAEEDGED